MRNRCKHVHMCKFVNGNRIGFQAQAINKFILKAKLAGKYSSPSIGNQVHTLKKEMSY